MVNNLNLLVVDDESSIRKLLSRSFQEQGYTVTSAEDGREALQLLQNNTPDVVILDLNLPHMTGQEVCRYIRGNPATKNAVILIITGGSTENLPVECLDDGADDYITKPFSVQELSARIRAILRRPRLFEHNDVIQKGDISIERGAHRVTVQNKELQLAPKEFDVFYQLLIHSPHVVNRKTLALKVWGISIEFLHNRTLDVHIRRLRKKLGTAASSLKTVQTLGFQWLPSDKSSLDSESPS